MNDPLAVCIITFVALAFALAVKTWLDCNDNDL